MLTSDRLVAVAARAAVTATAMVVLCASCGSMPAARQTAAELSSGPSSRVTTYTPPPPSVPASSLDGVPLTPAEYSWRVDGTMREDHPVDDRDVPATAVVRRPGPLRFTLATAVEPLVARLLLYDRTGPDGTPVRADATVVDCFASPGCTVSRTHGGAEMAITYDDRSDATVAVLYVEYAAAGYKDVAENVSAYRASWVARMMDR